MTEELACTCGREFVTPTDGVTALEDHEVVVTVVRHSKSLYKDETGKWRLAHTAFRREDVEGKRKGKTVSLMREIVVSPSEIIRRAKVLNQEPAWIDDPVVANSPATRLRSIRSERFPKCLCVYADPISVKQAQEEGDPLGECLGHASLKKHCSFHGANDPLAWVNLISDLAENFDPPLHACSKRPANERG